MAAVVERAAERRRRREEAQRPGHRPGADRARRFTAGERVLFPACRGFQKIAERRTWAARRKRGAGREERAGVRGRRHPRRRGVCRPTGSAASSATTHKYGFLSLAKGGASPPTSRRRRFVPRAPRARVDGSPTPPATRNSVVLTPPRPPSPPGPRPRRGPGRGARGPFANQKNRRAQNDLGRRPSTAQARRRGPWRRTRTTTRTRRATTADRLHLPVQRAGPGAARPARRPGHGRTSRPTYRTADRLARRKGRHSSYAAPRGTQRPPFPHSRPAQAFRSARSEEAPVEYDAAADDEKPTRSAPSARRARQGHGLRSTRIGRRFKAPPARGRNGAARRNSAPVEPVLSRVRGASIKDAIPRPSRRLAGFARRYRRERRRRDRLSRGNHEFTVETMARMVPRRRDDGEEQGASSSSCSSSARRLGRPRRRPRGPARGLHDPDGSDGGTAGAAVFFPRPSCSEYELGRRAQAVSRPAGSTACRFLSPAMSRRDRRSRALFAVEALRPRDGL